ncbi:MAG TPA: hypothetical protein PLD20_19485 [Blastocatellia bacterium]|nr:hypothetical protein [Blastocatellia bacterium]HMV83504.1 hypothetical protein [Blastocatellia bacterium]HMY74289.1 hypothetical protein [Blastocatellia bacterium]HMZ20130.1 hypothetical protein [Blastocatellia bacterium]HNG30862.1 hypothetical protein [Blastocatellia bacterium]
MFTQTPKTSGAAIRKLHSVHSLLIGREFKGEIEVGKARPAFTYSPVSATVANGKLELTGRFTVKAAGQVRKSENVKATLLATQGGLTTAPQAPRGIELTLLGKIPTDGLPATDATGGTGYVGVMYFRLSPLNGRTLGLPFDLSAVQLNGRLNPVDEAARVLQFWYSVAVRALYDSTPDESLAAKSVAEINQLLKV